jgi:hypothetical protein
VVLAASYESVSDAEVDYGAVKGLSYSAGVGHDFDAAVLERGTDGKVKVADSTRHPRATAAGKVCAAALQRCPARRGLREKDRAIVRAEFSESSGVFPRPSSKKTLNVEVGGVEPPSPGDLSGLLRAQPVGRSRFEAPTGGGPLGQPGCDVRRRPPGGAVAVSLLTTPILPSQAARRGRLPSYLGSERVFVIGACVCPGFSRGIRGPRPASPERFSLRSKPVHPRIRLSRQYTGGG